jgi:hypothetical protein
VSVNPSVFTFLKLFPGITFKELGTFPNREVETLFIYIHPEKIGYFDNLYKPNFFTSTGNLTLYCATDKLRTQKI